MLNAKPKPIMVIAGLLLLLTLLSGTSALTSRIGFTGTRQPGAFNGNTTPGGNLQGGNGGNIQGGNGNNGNFQGGGNNGNFQARGGGFNAFSLFRTTGINPQVIGYISTGITILGILLTLLCAYGVWKQKRWGLNLAMVLALLFLVAAVPGLFSLGGRNINWLRTSITILSLIASAPILVLGILPSVRDAVS